MLEIYNQLSALNKTSILERITNKAWTGELRNILAVFQMPFCFLKWIFWWISVWGCEALTNTGLWGHSALRIDAPFEQEEDLLVQTSVMTHALEKSTGIILMCLLFAPCLIYWILAATYCTRTTPVCWKRYRLPKWFCLPCTVTVCICWWQMCILEQK